MGSGHIGLLLPSFRVGGAQKNLLHIAEELVRRGYDLDLLVIRSDGAFKDHIPPEIQPTELDCSRSLTCLPCLVSYLRTAEPDVLLTTLEAPCLIATWATQLARVETRVVLRVANVNSYRQNPGPKRRLLSVLKRHTYSHADSIIAISNDVKEDLIDHFGVPPDMIDVVYNPAFTPDILSKREHRPDHDWFQDPDQTVIIGVGRLAPQKDFLTLVDAFDYVRSEHDAKLLILGEGDQRDALERRIADLQLTAEVSLPGFVDNPYNYMYHADLFVLSSIYEGFGNVLVEALACELPVVATDCPGGPAEILQNGEFGTLTSVGDPRALADTMTTVLETDPDTTRLVDRAREFSAASITNQYLEAAGLD